ncbi:MAG: alpha-galactosidase [Microbacteriaceae bacterium]|nr:alpha-galactosidase [Microbacteriaceae bacterium]
MTQSDNVVVVLRASGVCLAVNVGVSAPRVLHWGRDLGDLDGPTLATLAFTGVPAVLNNSPDQPRFFGVWPTEFDGWSGTQAQTGHTSGTGTTPRPRLVEHEVCVEADGSGGRLTLRWVDAISGTRPTVVYDLSPEGVLTVDMSIVRDGSLPSQAPGMPYDLGGLTAMLPLPERATEIADFAGKWCRERSIQRFPVVYGTHRRVAHRGKPGHDSPYLTLVGTPAFGFRYGEVWGMHVAWSGNQHTLVERLPEGAGVHTTVLGGGESLMPGEVRLTDGDEYRAPSVKFVWSDAGIDGVAARLHRDLRARSTHPTSPRPLVLNTWEAVYFDHDIERLSTLVDRAAEVGVERVVLDDGWFLGRRNANAGLGDWFVDEDVWPNGLTPIVERVKEQGMQFGLWFEPEMVNLDSAVARNHPEWMLTPSEGVGPSSRKQYVLNIAHPAAFAYLLERIDRLVREYGIDYIKWDHNRDLHEAVYRSPEGDRPGVRSQTLALYALLDELRTRHPSLEIETCSGGGGRIDLGILERTDRVWASDCNDPVERGEIERWTGLLLPPELIGSHLGAAVSHTTARTTDITYRLTSSIFAHAGIEWDITTCTAEELTLITRWSAMYREFRSLIHSGTVVNADLADAATALRGVVAPTGSHALFTWSRVSTTAGGQSGRVRFPGLDRERDFEIRIREDLGAARRHGGDPAWVTGAIDTWFAVPGSVLVDAGLPLPTLNPQQAMLIEVRSA